MNTEELKRLAEAVVSASDNGTCREFEIARMEFRKIADPAAVLELIDYIDYLRGKNREHFDACIGCDEELKRVTKQRDELLEALKESQSVNFWVSCQRDVVEKCMCAGCIEDRVQEAIAKAEG